MMVSPKTLLAAVVAKFTTQEHDPDCACDACSYERLKTSNKERVSAQRERVVRPVQDYFSCSDEAFDFGDKEKVQIWE